MLKSSSPTSGVFSSLFSCSGSERPSSGTVKVVLFAPSEATKVTVAAFASGSIVVSNSPLLRVTSSETEFASSPALATF